MAPTSDLQGDETLVEKRPHRMLGDELHIGVVGVLELEVRGLLVVHEGHQANLEACRKVLEKALLPRTDAEESVAQKHAGWPSEQRLPVPDLAPCLANIPGVAEVRSLSVAPAHARTQHAVVRVEPYTIVRLGRVELATVPVGGMS